MKQNANESDQKAQENQPNLNVANQGIPEVYANVVATNFNAYEFELTLGLASANWQGIRPMLNARISPQLAKELAKNLTESIRLYEEQIGEIPEMKK